MRMNSNPSTAWGLAVLKDLEVVLGEAFDDLAVLSGVGVHAHQHGAGTEHRQLLRRRRRLLGLG
jgi:hypothetical protein